MKSNVSVPLELLYAVYLDAYSLCPADVSPDLRDWKTIQTRVKTQGISFLTITLPTFCKDFERSLANGFIDSKDFQYFRKSRALPAFLQGALSRVFDHETGRLLDENHETPLLVAAVRQICLLYKKVGLPCSSERNYAAIANFIAVEQLNSEFCVAETDISAFAAVSDVLWTNCLANINISELVPRHGPGATAEGASGNQKFLMRKWHDRLDRVFPLDNVFSPNAFFPGTTDGVDYLIDDCVKMVTIVPQDQEPPVKVTLVPKTLKGPRIIAIEPVCNQYAQQAVQSELYRRIESYWFTRGHVNFTDQAKNQSLALSSSHDGRFATIDLNDASDRVLHSVVEIMFRSNPILWELIEACRSDKAKLPDGRILGPLRKFASMGSALCFPVEAMYFYTICIVALLKSRNLPPTAVHIHACGQDVYVYGDDIIVPVDEAGTVIDHLSKYNCKVNNSKTFLTGKFRESCGVDAYAGREVTPTYLRHMPPDDRRQTDRLISWIATANAFREKGYFRTAELMFCTCERILGPLPILPADSEGLGRISFYGESVTTERWNSELQVMETLAWAPSLIYRSDEVDGYPALQKCLLRLISGEGVNRDTSEFLSVEELLASSDKRHLERTARRGAVTLKRRWVQTS